MEELFDKLAKEASGAMSRRQVFRRFGWGLAVAVFGAFGVSRVSADDCHKVCADCCRGLDFPPRSAEHAQCIRDCHQGLNLCGAQAGCPQSP